MDGGKFVGSLEPKMATAIECEDEDDDDAIAVEPPPPTQHG